MYFGIKARVVGDFVLKEPIFTHSKGFKISIFAENGEYIISAIKLIPENSPLQVHYKISGEYQGPIAPDESAYSEYIRLFQDVEALGGFNYGVRKIFYKETLELCWYTGKEAFQDLYLICSLKKHFNPPKKKILTQSNLSSILFLKDHISYAKVPYTYFREADVFLQNTEYRLAYLHFFMLLEFCYTSHTKQQEVIKDFSNSANLNLATLLTLKALKESDSDIQKWLQNVLKQRSKDYCLKNIYYILFSYRGKLAHGSKSSSSFLFDENDLRMITIFIGQICFYVCGNMQVYCMSSDTYNQNRINERIKCLKEELQIS